MAPTTDPAAPPQPAPPGLAPLQLTVDGLLLTGRSGPVAPALELAVRSGELLVTGIGSPLARTATGLALTGQLRGWSGRMALDGAAVRSARDRAGLRARAALVDPADGGDVVGGLAVGSVAAEQLAAAGVAVRGGTAAWLAQAGLAGSAGSRLDALAAAERTRLLTELALARPGVGLLVLDSPDRHDGFLDWIAVCSTAAARGAAVVALVAVATATVLGAGPSGAGSPGADETRESA